ERPEAQLEVALEQVGRYRLGQRRRFQDPTLHGVIVGAHPTRFAQLDVDDLAGGQLHDVEDRFGVADDVRRQVDVAANPAADLVDPVELRLVAGCTRRRLRGAAARLRIRLRAQLRFALGLCTHLRFALGLRAQLSLALRLRTQLRLALRLRTHRLELLLLLALARIRLTLFLRLLRLGLPPLALLLDALAFRLLLRLALGVALCLERNVRFARIRFFDGRRGRLGHRPGFGRRLDFRRLNRLDLRLG